ncbi:hypothetical protein [Vibrio sp. 10N.261.55.A7]|uniref:hypothetical protein n=1 Tax=Vibrio TaxID=662 RepID=UPI000C864BE3|nr:hypothetical protein [Vibrio sp. 10N.261.55.A7]PMK00226.1 hypothetical protein BCU12_20250 [Vibrio sp. 10N.261.55.A7]
MNRSEIIVPVELQADTDVNVVVSDETNESVTQANASMKLRKAYQSEKNQLEVTEVELNRSRIFMIDKNGNMRIVPLMSEH